MSIKRNLERQHKRLQVLYGPDQASRTGFSQDLSVTGLFIQANAIFPPKTRLKIVLRDPVGGDIHLLAKVVWAKKVHSGMVRQVKGGMGLLIERFIEGEGHYRSLLQDWH